MNTTFVLPAAERGYNKFLSTGESSSYIAGHPEATLTPPLQLRFGSVPERPQRIWKAARIRR